MQKHLFVIAAVAAATPSSILYAAAIPIAVTGQNQHIVVPIGATDVATSTTADYDNGPRGIQNTFYQLGQNAAVPTTGLPVGVPFRSAKDPTVTYLIPSAGNDDFQLNKGSVARPSPRR